MQRKFLEDLGLEKDVIDKIMTENGNDINNAKKKLEAERDNYKEQLETAQTALKEFEGVDVKELNGKITSLTNDLAKQQNEYQTKIADMEFQSVLDTVIKSSNAKDTIAVKAFLDVDALKTSKNQSEDIKTAVEKLKSEKDYLFESDEPFQNPVAPTNNPDVSGITKEAFSKMGYAERVKLKQTDPTKYNELKG